MKMKDLSVSLRLYCWLTEGNHMKTKLTPDQQAVTDRLEGIPDEPKVTVVTNHMPRPVLYWWDLTDKEKTEFDYLDSEDKQDGGSFMRYKGHVYDINEFQSISKHVPHIHRKLQAWDGFMTDSYFSGVLIKWYTEPDYRDRSYTEIVVGTYYA